MLITPDEDDDEAPEDDINQFWKFCVLLLVLVILGVVLCIVFKLGV